MQQDIHAIYSIPVFEADAHNFIERHTSSDIAGKYNLFNIGFVWNGKSGKKVILIDQNARRF